MLFIHNKYTDWYYSIITNAQQQNRKKLKRSDPNYVPYENHHIIPECFFINRKRKGPSGWLEGNPEDKSNKVLLTVKEHFVCHHLLTKMLLDKRPNAQMAKALERMLQNNQYHSRYKITAKMFEHIRIQAANAHSILLTGKRGRKHSAETIIKQKDAANKQNRFREKNGFYGKNHNEEALSKMRGSRPTAKPWNKGLANLPPSGKALIWQIIDTNSNTTETILSLRCWAKSNNFTPSSVDSAVRKRGVWLHYHITKLI